MVEKLVFVGILLAVGYILWLLYRRGAFSSPTLSKKVADFFGQDPSSLPIISKKFTRFDLPNIEVAVRRFLEQTGSKDEVVGYSAGYSPFGKPLSEIVVGEGMFERTKPGPVSYKQIDIGPSETLNCVENGLHFISGPAKLLCHVRFNPLEGATEVEVMAKTADEAQAFFDQIASILARENVYQGKVLTIEGQVMDKMRGECAAIRFHNPVRVQRDDIILPEVTLNLIERNTIGFFEKVHILKQSGRSAKRGILLYGKPGTGKTFTAKWLATGVPGLTTIVMSAEQLYLIKDCCILARMLAPSLVIMEDIDLVATHRNEQNKEASAQITLHQILNELDGMADNTEVLFLMTTNRPDAIEPALAGRPGRVDQAIEYPLPDADCRRRLIEKYSKGIESQINDMDSLVTRLEGASPAFIQELLRKALLVAAEREPLVVTDEDVDVALRELLFGGGDLTRQLLGFTIAK